VTGLAITVNERLNDADLLLLPGAVAPFLRQGLLYISRSLMSPSLSPYSSSQTSWLCVYWF
jgi:hypothetical protein